MRVTWRTILLILFAILVAAFCATGVGAQERSGRRGREMRGDQHSQRQSPQAQPRNWDGFDGRYNLSPRRNQYGPRSYNRGRSQGYDRRPRYRSDSWGYRPYGNRYGYGNRYRSYGYRYGYRPYSGYGYSYGYQNQCSVVVLDAYGRAYRVPGFWSYDHYSSICIPY